MNKLIAIDLDSTLAKINNPIASKTIGLLKKLITKGYHIMIISGKPTIYLSGVFRNYQLKNIYLSGENGLEIHYGTTLPPDRYHTFIQNDDKVILELNKLKNQILKLNGNYFFQNNQYSITPFFNDLNSKMKLFNFACDIQTSLKYTSIYGHTDSIDFTPKHINKGNSLAYLLNELNIDPKDAYAIGDNQNDIPMFKIVKNSILITNNINNKLDYQTTFVYNNIYNALSAILQGEI